MESGVDDLDAWHKAQAGRRMLNYGAGTGHNRARNAVMGGNNEEKPATDAQVREMLEFLDRALRRGALGVGFGLEYTPASRRWEVLEIFRVAGRHHASCHAHIRFGTLLEDQSVIDAAEEVIAASVLTGAPIHILHVPSMALSETRKILQMVEEAQRRGLDVTSDFYPYTAFGTGSTSEVFSEGWQKRFGITYSDLEWAATHERLTAESFAKYRQISGMIIAHAIPEAAVRAAVASSGTMLASDGGINKGVGHPRSSGSFARVLGRYVRQEKLISLEMAIEKMTLRPARRMEARCAAFRRKGRIRVGADADLTIFDPATVIDRATYDKPAETSVGMRYVLVGGTPVVWQGKLQENVRPGKGLRAPVR
jgi:N-acyl-D-aspartate/D-glutamate deacylase